MAMARANGRHARYPVAKSHHSQFRRGSLMHEPRLPASMTTRAFWLQVNVVADER